MKTLFKPIALILTVILFAACSTLRKVDLTKVHTGMSKAEVQAALQKKPVNIVASRHFTNPDADVEVLEYTDNVVSYYLYFVNNKLDKWHKVTQGEHAPTLTYYNFGDNNGY
ncbi:hypothetical protein MUY27_06230 [Mucilaginibacter sp. RS28]|uniref:Lipoprotein SmpA/OmlA domain-containing protein n=1 Tax=Mucilaginibacter straminoryzae TaxID=2932774 RepID=A0A9X2BCH1_9SPHI|nr:hypothetical protein [Mucilaginibacter straminoryzae]MCJ8209298.1 hypothetical protein [Mucilaginibacter straminoryzae]